jgi:MerR family redox-sensitive transcriptional activator SoxR
VPQVSGFERRVVGLAHEIGAGHRFEEIQVRCVGRVGFAPSTLRFYEREGLVRAARSAGGQRRYDRSVLRRLAFIRAARHVGLSLDEVRRALTTLPSSRTPTRADWTRISRSWRGRLDAEIDALVALRDGLDGCIGCGCLSLQTCRLANPGDAAAVDGPGAVDLPKELREPLPADLGKISQAPPNN